MQTTVLSVLRGGGFTAWTVLALSMPVALLTLARSDSRSTGKTWSIVRDWVPAPLLLVAYWSADWVPQSPSHHTLERALIGWDRTVLNDWGLRAAVERFGPLLPTFLDLAYLMVSAVPPLAIAYFYVRRERRLIDDFLFPFLLGTLTTYALLPHFPSMEPRIVFPGADLPGVETVFRRFNVWILDHADIHSSVFPSGHVTVAFSAAFAMFFALPQHRVGWTLLAMSILVLIDTVYGRYHYAADGLAGLAISLTAFGVAVVHRTLVVRRRM